MSVEKLNNTVDTWLAKNRPDVKRVSDRVGSADVFEVRCEKHPNPIYPWSSTLSRLKAGAKCPDCNPRSGQPITNDFIDAWLLQNAKTYKRDSDCDSAKSDLYLICEKHGRIKTTWDTFRKHKRCTECYKDSRFQPRKVDNDYLDKFLLDNGGNIVRIGDCLGADRKTMLHCKIDGYEWEGTYNNLAISFRNKTKGCPKCSGVAKKTNKDVDDYLENLGCGYKRLTDCDGAYGYILVDCEKHQPFPVTTTNLLRGRGCPRCATHGFKINKSGYLYYAYLNGVYKIGITGNKVEYRLKRQHDNYKLLDKAWFKCGADAAKMERIILKKYADKLVDGYSVGVIDGRTETFCEDVLNSSLYEIIFDNLDELNGSQTINNH